jgi:lipoprotein signal peptidase
VEFWDWFIKVMQESPKKQSDSTGKKILMWILTLVGIVLFARLLTTLLNLAFNFSNTPIGRCLDEGLSFNFLSDLSLKNIVIQLAIIAVVVTLFIVSKKSSKNHGKK